MESIIVKAPKGWLGYRYTESLFVIEMFEDINCPSQTICPLKEIK